MFKSLKMNDLYVYIGRLGEENKRIFQSEETVRGSVVTAPDCAIVWIVKKSSMTAVISCFILFYCFIILENNEGQNDHRR